MIAIDWLRARIIVCVLLLCCRTTGVTRAEPSSQPSDYSNHDRTSLVLSFVTTSGEVHVIQLEERGETFEASAQRFCSGLTAVQYKSCVADVVRAWQDLWRQQQQQQQQQHQQRYPQEMGGATIPLQERLEPQPRVLVYHRGEGGGRYHADTTQQPTNTRTSQSQKQAASQCSTRWPRRVM